jgi:hypothetical protein
MTRHLVEVCPDDLEALRARLDQLSEDGSRILSVMWQALNVVEEQSAAMTGRGSFVIIAQREVPNQFGTEPPGLDVKHDGP